MSLRKLRDKLLGRPTFKMVAHFHLKSGTVLKVRCDNVKLEVHGTAIQKYDVQGAATGDLFHVCIPEIAAITLHDY